jgi:AbrB family looped-hinge helix DNA binding protein
MNTYRVDNQGRIMIPSKWRSQQGIKAGTELVVFEEDGRLIVQTREQAVREAQEMLRRFVPPGVSLVEELLKQRRSETERERRPRKTAPRKTAKKHGKRAR